MAMMTMVNKELMKREAEMRGNKFEEEIDGEED